MANRGTREVRIYPAIFTRNGDSISVEYPDLPGCVTCAHSEEEAAERAKEALEGFLYYMEKDKDPIPLPTGQRQLHFPVDDNYTSPNRNAPEL